MDDLLKKLWETYKETPFSQNAIGRDLSLNWEEQQTVIHQLNELENQPPKNGLRIKSVASGIFKVIRSEQGEANPTKDLPLSPAKETLTGKISEKPHFLSTVPAELKALRQWVVWKEEKRDGKPTKVPYQISDNHAQANNPETWTDFNAVIQRSGHFAGVGFVFRDSDPYCGIDLDNCMDEDGNIKSWAQPIVERLKSVGYGEVSPSGKGLKFWTRASLPVNTSHRRSIDDGKIEIYDHSRYFTVTGKGRGNISNGQATVDWLCNTYLAKPKTDKRSANTPSTSSTATVDEIVQQIQQSRQSAKFNALMDGNTTGYSSQSEADLALCSMVVFWTQDPNTIDVIFRQSRLMRDKWDEKHRADGTTYGQMTIEKAIIECSEVYTPRKRTHSRNKRRYRSRTVSARRNL